MKPLFVNNIPYDEFYGLKPSQPSEVAPETSWDDDTDIDEHLLLLTNMLSLPEDSSFEDVLSAVAELQNQVLLLQAEDVSEAKDA